MSRSDRLEIGRWYSFVGLPPTQRGRPVQVRRYEEGAILGRFASGQERLIITEHIGDQVEDAVPGVTEKCLVCGGTETVPVIEASADEPWSGHRAGTRPCPNCRGLH